MIQLPELNVRFMWRKFFDNDTYRYYERMSKGLESNGGYTNGEVFGYAWKAGYAAGVSTVVDSFSLDEKAVRLETMKCIRAEIDTLISNLEYK